MKILKWEEERQYRGHTLKCSFDTDSKRGVICKIHLQLDDYSFEGESNNYVFCSSSVSFTQEQAFESALETLLENLVFRASGRLLQTMETNVQHLLSKIEFEKQQIQEEKELIEKLKPKYKNLLE